MSSRAHLFENRGGQCYWRCIRCGVERDAMFSGVFVSVGNEAVGIACEESCSAAAVLIVRAAFESARRFHTAEAQERERQSAEDFAGKAAES